jgi:Flp pilus assembly protein protease CpaA
MVQDSIVKIILLTWLLVCAWQDGRTGEVSNWLTLPAMASAGLFALASGRDALLLFAAALLGVFILFYLGSLGGADAKILVVLAGCWPMAFFAAVLMQGVWGLVMLVRKGRTAGFRAVPSYLAGVLVFLVIGII